MFTVARYCFSCQQYHTIELKAEYFTAYNDWQFGQLLQNTKLIELPVEIREQLISGLCPKCQELIFVEPKDEEEF